MPGKRICIIGAGLAGLSAAYFLKQAKRSCALFEQEAVPGGLCRSRTVAGFTFDYSGHLLHFRDRSMLALVNRLVPGGLIEHRRNAWVYTGNGFVRYPFQANLYGLSRDIAQECLLGFIRARCRRGSTRAAGLSFSRWIQDAFGHGIARHFMLPYNRKFWTVPASTLTTEWLDGFIPVPRLEEVIEGSLGLTDRQFGYNSRFWYPARGGIQALPDALAGRLPPVQTGMRVTRVDLKRKRICLNDRVWERYDTLISTMPLPQWLKTSILPQPVKSALQRLKWTSVRALNLGLKSAEPEPRHWIYFPQPRIPFFRCGFSHAFAKGNAPVGTRALYVEFSRPGGPDGAAAAMPETKVSGIIERLRGIGCIGPEDELIVKDAVDIPCAYVIYDRQRSAAVETVKRYLAGHEVHCCGRYGSWEYLSMEGTILQAALSVRFL